MNRLYEMEGVFDRSISSWYNDQEEKILLIISLIMTARFDVILYNTIFFSKKVTLHGNRTIIHSIFKISTDI